jgi:hypothetical protein
MKSDFSHFLHHFLSYSGLTRISRWKNFATWFDLDTLVKPECDSIGADASAGRSMVEMLGVLAIIGVLSVGAIAGYSKAMMKYKLNKQAESFNELINNAIKIKPELDRAKSGAFWTDFFAKANLIPDGMRYNQSQDPDFMYDVFNNATRIYYVPQNGGVAYVSITVLPRSGKKLTNRDREICRNLVTIAKENAANLSFIEMRSGSSDTGLGDTNYKAEHLIGDIYPNNVPSTTKFLRNVSIADIDDFCNSCDSDYFCYFIIFYE